MTSSPAPFETRPLLVVALGGNALSPPSGDPSYDVEREIVKATTKSEAEEREQILTKMRALLDDRYGDEVAHRAVDDLIAEILDES